MTEYLCDDFMVRIFRVLEMSVIQADFQYKMKLGRSQRFVKQLHGAIADAVLILSILPATASEPLDLEGSMLERR